MLILNKRQELKMTQVQFADYFSNLTGNTVTYGFIQALENAQKASIPEWINMKGIATLYGLTLDELDLYLTDDTINDLSEVSEATKKMNKELENDPQVIFGVIKKMDIKDKVEILKAVTDEICKKLAELEGMEGILSQLKGLGLSQN